MIKSIIYFIQSLIIYFFFILGRILGLSLSRKIFSNVFYFIGPIFKSKKVIFNNLITFKENISELEKKVIIANMWKNYGKTFIEYVFLDYFRKSKNHVKIKGIDNLNKILEEKKPVIFVSGHFSNFELMSMEITKKDINLATIYRPLNNYFLNPLMEYLRKKYVCKHQIKKGIKGVRESIDFIKKGYSVALMIDQRVSEGEKIDFFGKPALTTTLPAQLALKYKIPIIPVFIERVDENFTIQFFDKIIASDFQNKNELTSKLNNILEKMIVDNPNEWIWTHNRWK